MHFLGKDEEEIRSIALETMEGHQRAIMGTMTVEQIYQDRKEFSKQVKLNFFVDYRGGRIQGFEKNGVSYPVFVSVFVFQIRIRIRCFHFFGKRIKKRKR